jgi:hypothetical protein
MNQRYFLLYSGVFVGIILIATFLTFATANVTYSHPTIYCADSDGGKKPTIFGYVSFSYNDGVHALADDSCFEKGNVDGRIFKSSCNGDNCYMGETYCQRFTYTSYTGDPFDFMMSQFFAVPNNYLYTLDYKCSSCSRGECVLAEDSCNDSDNGADIYVKGIVKSVKDGKYSESSDKCANSGFSRFNISKNNINENTCVLIKGTGATSRTLRTSQTRCPTDYLCYDGACISDQCVDSDHGKDYYIKGSTYTKNNPTLISTDRCNSIYDLAEYSCDSTTHLILGDMHRCPIGCSDGKCVPDGSPGSPPI